MNIAMSYHFFLPLALVSTLILELEFFSYCMSRLGADSEYQAFFNLDATPRSRYQVITKTTENQICNGD